MAAALGLVLAHGQHGAVLGVGQRLVQVLADVELVEPDGTVVGQADVLRHHQRGLDGLGAEVALLQPPGPGQALGVQGEAQAQLQPAPVPEAEQAVGLGLEAQRRARPKQGGGAAIGVEPEGW